MKRTFIYIILILLGWSCTYEFPDTDVILNGGSADFSKFVCIGDNFTSGFMNGALYTEGQENSIGSLIAQQLEEATGGVFFQADIASENGYNLFASDSTFALGKLISKYYTPSSEQPVIYPLPGELPAAYTGEKELLTDFSIPYLKSYQVNRPDLSANLYFNRLATNPGTSTLLEQVDASSPSFFLFWVGMYDALHYAMSGAMGEYDPPSDPDLLSDNDLTPDDVFENSIRQMIATLMANPQTKGVVVNLPSFDDLPFFYYYPYDFIKLTNGQKATAQQYYTDFNSAVTIHNQIPDSEPRPYIDFNDNGQTLFPQPVVVVDDSLSDGVDQDGNPLPKIRQLVPGEMIFLKIPINQVPLGLGSLIPLEKEFYLKSLEIHGLRVAINKYNDVLSEIVAEYPDRLVLADLNTSINEIAATGKIDSWGIPESFEFFYQDGLPLKADISINSIFSLDGLHFNQRGNAYVSNLIIEVINLHFGSNITPLEVNQYVGNTVVLGY